MRKKHSNFDVVAINDYPLREITPTEVYELAIRLEDEIDLVHKIEWGKKFEINDSLIEISTEEKIPSDVYQKMWQNSYIMDTIIGPQGYTPTDVYQEAKRIVGELELLRKKLHVHIPVREPKLQADKTPGDVIVIARKIIDQMDSLQKWAGMQGIIKNPNVNLENVTPNEVYNEVGIILAEIVALKVHLDISDTFKIKEKKEKKEKTPSDVFQVVEYALQLVKSIAK